MKCIKLFFKRRRLLKKYRPTLKQMQEDIWLVRGPMANDWEFRIYLAHIRACEIRCYNRIKKL